MEPNRIGRVLGIGARVAGNKLRDEVDRLGTPPSSSTSPSHSASPPTSSPPPLPPAPSRPSPATVGAAAGAAVRNFQSTVRAENARRAAPPTPDVPSAPSSSRRFARGAGRFGAAFFHPFAHATSVLWYQIMGIFFALFCIFFAEHAWFVYKASRFHDRHVFVYGALAILFAWFTLSSFWRSRRKPRRG